MVYGDEDGEIFGRFTASLDVIAHELGQGVNDFLYSFYMTMVL